MSRHGKRALVESTVRGIATGIVIWALVTFIVGALFVSLMGLDP